MNLTGVFITYKTDDTKSKWYHRFFIYESTLKSGFYLN